MKILVTGASGLVGSRFAELSRFKSSLYTPDLNELDILNKSAVVDYLEKHQPEVVVNFAAYTNTSEGEKQRGDKTGLCWQLNVQAMENLIYALHDRKSRLIQISTDMVFSGSADNPGPYDEKQVPEKNSEIVTWYGFTKAEAERKVIKSLGKEATILRLIYPVRASFADKLDFLRKPLKLFDEGKLYPLFADQQMAISFVDEITTALDAIIEKNAYGTFHAASADLTTPYEVVSYLLAKARNAHGVVQKSSLVEFLKTVDSPVRYPLFGGLKVSKTEERLGIQYSQWKEIIDQLVDQGVFV